MDSYPPAALVHVHIFCRCYSLVLNVGTLENPESCYVVVVVVVVVVIVVVVVVVDVLLEPHMDLWCYMFLFAAFLNYQRGMTDAT